MSIEKDRNGPPTGKPINIEITGDDYNKLIDLTHDIKVKIENPTANPVNFTPAEPNMQIEAIMQRLRILI